MEQKSALRDFFGLGKKNRHGYIKTIVICALLTAISVVLKTVLEFNVPMFGVNSQAINMSFAIIIFAGLVYGPLWGGLVGAASDLIACVLFPMGPIIPGITLTNFFIGFFAGVFAFIFAGQSRKIPYLLGFCGFISIFSSLCNSFWIWQALSFLNTKYTYLIYALPRLAFSLCIMLPLNTVVLYFIMNKAVPILEREKLLQ